MAGYNVGARGLVGCRRSSLANSSRGVNFIGSFPSSLGIVVAVAENPSPTKKRTRVVAKRRRLGLGRVIVVALRAFRTGVVCRCLLLRLRRKHK